MQYRLFQYLLLLPIIKQQTIKFVFMYLKQYKLYSRVKNTFSMRNYCSK